MNTSEGAKLNDAEQRVLSGILRKIGIHRTAIDNDGKFPDYLPGIDVLECLQDLKSFIDKSDIPVQILCCLCEWRAVEEHFCPLLLSLSVKRQTEAVLLCLRVLAFIVNPNTSDSDGFHGEWLHWKRILKRSMGSEQFLGHLLKIFVQVISTDCIPNEVDRQEVIKAVMFVVKGIVLIPDASIESRNHLYGRQEQVLESFIKCRLFEFILALTNQFSDYGYLFVSILEIFAGLFSVPIDQISEQSAEKVIEDEVMRKPIRHGNFAGSVVVQLLTGKEVLLKASSQFTSGMDYDVGKKQFRRIKTREYSKHHANVLPHQYKYLYRRATDDFLNSAFNILMNASFNYIKECSDNIKASQICQLTTKLSVYCLNYQIAHSRDRKLVSSALSLDFAFLLHRFFSNFVLEKDWEGAILGCQYWKLFIQSTVNQEDRDLIYRAVFYDYDILRFPATVLSLVQNPGRETIIELIEFVHYWCKCFDEHCNSGVVFVSKKKKSVRRSDEESRDDEPQWNQVESEFKFSSLLSEFEKEDIVNSICILLKCAKENSPKVNRHLAKFINRLYNQLGAKDLFHKIIVLDSIQKVLSMNLEERRDNQELIMMSRHICKGFFDSVKENMSLYVEALLSQTCCGISTKTHKVSAVSNMDNTEDNETVNSSNSVMNRSEEMRRCIEALVSEELSNDLNWLCVALNTALDTFKAADEMCMTKEPIKLLADKESRKKLLRSSQTLKKLLRIIDCQYIDGYWWIHPNDGLSDDLQSIMDIKERAEMNSSFDNFKSSNINQVISSSDKEFPEERHDESEDELADEKFETALAEVAQVKKRWKEMKENQFLAGWSNTDSIAKLNAAKAGLPLLIDSEEE